MRNINPLVTIAIPFYNDGKYLKYSVQSVINQTYNNWELLLIDDGSTDNSLMIANEFKCFDSRIKVISDGENKKLAIRLNESVKLAKGKYYARMDADDIMYLTRIEEQVHFLETHAGIDVVGTSMMSIDNNNRIVGSGFNEGKVERFIHPTILGKTEWFIKNPYAEWCKRCQDTELWLRTYKTSNFYAIGKPLLFYRELGMPTLRKEYLSTISYLKILKRYKEYNLPGSWFVKNLILAIVKLVAYVALVSIKQEKIIQKKRSWVPVPSYLRLSDEDLEKSIKTDKYI